MTTGQVLDGTIELKNVGTSTWKAGETKLAPTPRDQPSPIGGGGAGDGGADHDASLGAQAIRVTGGCSVGGVGEPDEGARDVVWIAAAAIALLARIRARSSRAF